MAATAVHAGYANDLASRRCAPGQARINVGTVERLASLAGGGVLAAYGFSRGSAAGIAAGLAGAALAYRGYTGHCSVYQTLGVSTADHKESTSIPSGQGVKIEQSITIQKSPDELYRYWRNLENLPHVMPHLLSVRQLDAKRSHWTAQGLTGPIEWDAEIIEDRPGEMLSWRSLDGSEVATAGSVHFRPLHGDRGTEVRVVLSYNPPGGQAGHAIAWIAGRDPASQVRQDLRDFKCLLETGSVPSSRSQSSSCCGS